MLVRSRPNGPDPCSLVVFGLPRYRSLQTEVDPDGQNMKRKMTLLPQAEIKVTPLLFLSRHLDWLVGRYPSETGYRR